MSGWQFVVWAFSEEDAAKKRAKEFISNLGVNFKPDSSEFPNVWQYKQFPYEESPVIVSDNFFDFITRVSAKLPKTLTSI